MSQQHTDNCIPNWHCSCGAGRMTTKREHVEVLRDLLRSELEHSGKGYPLVEARIAALEAAISSLTAQSAAVAELIEAANAIRLRGHEDNDAYIEGHERLTAALTGERHE